MDQATFLKRLAEALDHGGALEPAQAMESIDGWDSLGILATIELFADIGAEASGEDLGRAKTVADLIALAGGAVDGAA